MTGGIAPNLAGVVSYGASKMTNQSESDRHKIVTKAVHDNGGKIGKYLHYLVKFCHWSNIDLHITHDIFTHQKIVFA